MPTFHFTDVTVSSGGTDYLQQGTGTADGDNVLAAKAFACKCKQPPAITTLSEDGRAWHPVYTISGTNPSGLRIQLRGRCTFVGFPREASNFKVDRNY